MQALTRNTLKKEGLNDRKLYTGWLYSFEQKVNRKWNNAKNRLFYFKIWTWLLLKAQHKDYGNLKRGQLITSIAEIQEAMSYKVGFRTEKPSKKQVWGAA